MNFTISQYIHFSCLLLTGMYWDPTSASSERSRGSCGTTYVLCEFLELLMCLNLIGTMSKTCEWREKRRQAEAAAGLDVPPPPKRRRPYCCAK